MIVHMSRKGKPNKKQMPVDQKRNVFISLRLRESEKAIITRVIGDNVAIREFLLEYVKKHE